MRRAAAVALMALLTCVAARDGKKEIPSRGWLGHWQQGVNTIDISAGEEDRLVIDAQAYWGTNNPFLAKRGGVHEADFTVEVAPVAGQLRFAVGTRTGDAVDYDSDDALCHLTMQLEGRRLEVENPDECGGANVSFAGTYRRVRGSRRP